MFISGFSQAIYFISSFAVSRKNQEDQLKFSLILGKCNPDGCGLKGRAALPPEEEEDCVDIWRQERGTKGWLWHAQFAAGVIGEILLFAISRHIIMWVKLCSCNTVVANQLT